MSAPEGLLPAALRNRTSFVLVKLAELAREHCAEAVAVAGLNQHQHAILCCLDEFGAACQKDVAARLGIDSGDLVAFIDGLQRENLLVRERDQRDRRRQILTITAGGRRVLREIEGLLDAAEPEFLGVLSESERALLRDRALRVLAGKQPTAWSGRS